MNQTNMPVACGVHSKVQTRPLSDEGRTRSHGGECQGLGRLVHLKPVSICHKTLGKQLLCNWEDHLVVIVACVSNESSCVWVPNMQAPQVRPICRALCARLLLGNAPTCSDLVAKEAHAPAPFAMGI
jgi:hypothetical protein